MRLKKKDLQHPGSPPAGPASSLILYHTSTTLEFDKLIKANLDKDGVYLVNIIDNYQSGRYMPSFIYTLKQAFNYVYLFSTGESWDGVTVTGTFVIAATDRPLDFTDYRKFVTKDRRENLTGHPHDENKLVEYLAERKAILLTDDYVPTDILVARVFR